MNIDLDGGHATSYPPLSRFGKCEVCDKDAENEIFYWCEGVRVANFICNECLNDPEFPITKDTIVKPFKTILL